MGGTGRSDRRGARRWPPRSRWLAQAPRWLDTAPHRRFLEALSFGRSVSEAAAAAGISRKSAYAFRSDPRGAAFDAAWRAALRFARYRPPHVVRSRVTHRHAVPIFRRGKFWGERLVFDNRLAMATLTRLDRSIARYEADDAAMHALAADFDALVEAACAAAER